MSREEAEQHDGMMACRVKSRCDANRHMPAHTLSSLSPYLPTHPPTQRMRASELAARSPARLLLDFLDVLDQQRGGRFAEKFTESAR